MWQKTFGEASSEADSGPGDAAAHPLQRGRRILHTLRGSTSPRDLGHTVSAAHDRRGMTSTCDGPPAAHSPQCGTRRQLACDRSTRDAQRASCDAMIRVVVEVSPHLATGSWLESDRGVAVGTGGTGPWYAGRCIASERRRLTARLCGCTSGRMAWRRPHASP
jgi:hypothetical protein